MTVVEGYVNRIVYENTENGYKVLQIADSRPEAPLGEEATVLGTFPGVEAGQYLYIEGEICEHILYGPQLKASFYQEKNPEDALSMERYLASGAIKGVGPALALRIVKKFGADTFRIMEEEPERLSEIKGISETKAREIGAQVEEKRNLRAAMMFLQNYGISLQLAAKIYNQYGMELYNIIRTNPYRLAEDLSGVGFRMADEIAGKVGILTDSDFRIKSGIYYTLQSGAGNGHTYLPYEILVEQASALLQVEGEQIEKHLMDMVVEHRVVLKDTGEEKQVYSAPYYYTERGVAMRLLQLNIRQNPPRDLEERIRRLEQTSGLELDEWQKKAVKEAACNGVTIITGGPGTGKTTTINTIIQYFLDLRMEIRLAAPTGRAAKRMTETTGYEAQTLHRLLEISGGPREGNETMSYGRNELNPLECHVVIVDEMSMVDVFLMNALLKAMVPGMQLVMVGDADQLPSVGPGRVLRDIMESKLFSVVRLSKIFRQAYESDIIVNAHKINRGEMVEPQKGSKDFLFVFRGQPSAVVGATITLVREKLPDYIGVEWRDVQVLTPMRKGPLGVEQLNPALQQYLNPPEKDKVEKEHGGFIFREGDKVMQIKNNYQVEWIIENAYGMPVERGLGVFNGDVGIIRKINLFSEEVQVVFDEGRCVSYPFRQLDELELAYALTVHKAQGSEYAAVVLPLLAGPRLLMTRNLLYTAITRAKCCVTIVGNLETFQEMIQNVQEQQRYSGLTPRLLEAEKELLRE